MESACDNMSNNGPSQGLLSVHIWQSTFEDRSAPARLEQFYWLFMTTNKSLQWDSCVFFIFDTF